jgi:hypothetical protein
MFESGNPKAETKSVELHTTDTYHCGTCDVYTKETSCWSCDRTFTPKDLVLLSVSD